MIEPTAPHAEDDTATIDVLVVGAGPVGLALAIELARRGTGVRIIDALAAPTTESRAVAVHSRSLDHLQAMGALDALMERAIIARGMDFHTGDRVIGKLSFEAITAVRPHSVALAQTETEAVLTERLTALGVAVERSTTLSGYSQDAGGVTAEVTGPGDAARTIRARYLVGADGARSAVRHLMGQSLEGSFTGEDFLLGDVEADHDCDRSHFHSFLSPGESTALLLPLPGDRLRIFTQLPSGTDPERPATLEWLEETLTERGVAARIQKTHWLTRFRIKYGQVRRYRDRRVFLTGDAAHIHSPAGALGMNTGFQDAVNLGWKLARAVRTGHAEALLSSYEQERHPVAAEVISFTNRLTRVGTVENAAAQRVRNAVMHRVLAIPAITRRMSGIIEQQNVRYRDSAVVSGRGRSLRPGDYLYLPETDVAAALAATGDHLAVVLDGSADGDSPRLPDGISELRVSKRDADLLRRSARLPSGGVVVVRPDGYIGHIGGDLGGVSAYQRIIGR